MIERPNDTISNAAHHSMMLRIQLSVSCAVRITDDESSICKAYTSPATATTATSSVVRTLICVVSNSVSNSDRACRVLSSQLSIARRTSLWF